MAEVKKTGELDLNELVPITLFKDDGKYSAPLYVGINGKNWYIPRGKEFMIPRYVYNYIKECERAEFEAAMERDRLSSKFEEESKRI